MSSVPANPNFNALATTTLKRYNRRLVDNITGNQVLLAKLRQMGHIKPVDGGTKIVEQLLIGTNSTAGSYRGAEALDISHQEGISASEYDFKQSYVTISITGEEKAKNSGSDVKLIDLVQSKIRQAEISFKLEMNRQLWEDGSGNDNKDLNGLAIAVEEGSAWSTYGGIDSNDYVLWRNQFLDFTGAGNTSFENVSGSSVEGVRAMTNMYNSCGRQGDKVNLITCSQELWEAYSLRMEGQQLRMTMADKAMADLGFDNLMFRGAPVVWDENCPDNTMYFLNLEYLNLKVHKDRDFSSTDFQTPINADTSVAKIWFMGNITSSNRARQGVITNFVPFS